MTVISQYANSPIISQLVRDMESYIDPTADLAAFYDYVWNVETAQGFGLDVWGRIVNVSRELRVPDAPLYFGFEQQTGAYPFGEQPFYVGETTSSVYRLGDDAYRRLILTKALANISATSAPSLNRLLQNLFPGRGRCYVNDLGSMQMRYTFEFYLEPWEIAVLTQSGAFPRPAGVGAILLQTETPTFGFAIDSAPFGQGSFIAENALNAIV